MDTDEARSWSAAERHDKSNKATEKKLKNVKWTTVLIEVPICPKCKTPMNHELDAYARNMWKWTCSSCRHTI